MSRRGRTERQKSRGAGRAGRRNRGAEAPAPPREGRRDRRRGESEASRATRTERPTSGHALREPPRTGGPRKAAPSTEKPEAGLPFVPRPRPTSDLGRRFVWTCRPGVEAELLEELALGRPALRPERLGPSLVASQGCLADWPTFARTGFPVLAELVAEAGPLASCLAGPLAERLRRTPEPWVVQAWVPDADALNPLASRAESLESELRAALCATEPALVPLLRERRSALQRNEGLTVQVCLTAPTRALCGLVAAHELPTTAAGGRARSRAPKHAPSRAARKLVEAFDWIGQGPEPGERVVDLGAAPGGWTAVLLERGAHVVAVDLGQMDPALARHRNLRVIHGNAFHHEPEEPVGWLFCDLAWRPLEVASLLAKWGRRGWTDALVANLKLPMRKKLGFVERLRGMLGEGFRTVRARQLYHDREEVTFAAWRR